MTEGPERRLAAILAADVVGYSRLMEASEERTMAALKQHRREFFDPTIARHGGRIFKVMGDGFLVEFASVLNAARCAIEIQAGMAARNDSVPGDQRIVFRIGVNLGDVMVEGDDLNGDGVNVAARLERLADPGGICLSAKVYQEVRGKIEANFSDSGEQVLKNITQPVRVYKSSAGAPRPVVKERPGKASIAVLAFSDMNGDAAQDYFAEGIAEDVLTELSRFPSLFVIARNSSFSFRGKEAPPGEIARALGVAFVLTGSVRRGGNRVRVACQLVQADTGQEIWAERYDRALDDIFTVQDDVVRSIVMTLERRLETTLAAMANTRPVANLAAYDCVLLASKHIYLHERDAAMPFVLRALELDPDYARAQAMLAAVHYLGFLQTGDRRLIDSSLEAARRAVALDDGSSTCHGVLGNALTYKKSFELAGVHLARAMALNPADSAALGWEADRLLCMGQPEAALAMLDSVLEHDPIPPTWHWDVRATAYLVLGRYDEAILTMSRLVNLLWYNHAYLAFCHMKLGRLAEARAEVAKLLVALPGMTITQFRGAQYSHFGNIAAHMDDALRVAGLPE